MGLLKVIWRKIRPRRIGKYRFNEIVLKRNGFERVKNKIEVLALGSSHMAQAFNPKFYRSGWAFNMASMNLDLYTIEKLFNQYIPPHLQRVYLSFSVFSPGHEIDKGNNQELCFLLNYFYHIPYPHLHMPHGLQKALKHRLENFDESTLVQTKDFDGYFPIPAFIPKTSKRKQYKDLKKRVAHHLCENHRPTDQVYLLENIAHCCQKKKIELIVIITPHRQDYNQLIQQADKELFKSLFAAQKKYGFKILNWRCSKKFKDRDFLDADHLNPTGAEKFTKLLNL